MLKIRIGGSAPKALATARPVAVGETLPAHLQAGAAAEGFTGEAGSACQLFPPEGRLLLVGIGSAGESSLRDAGALAVARLGSLKRIALDARGLLADHAAAFAVGACLRAWRWERRGRPDPEAARLASVDLLSEAPGIAAAWHGAEASTRGALFARDLVVEPSDTLTPQGFIDRLGPLAQAGIEITVLRRKALAQAGLGCLLAVGHGSAHPSRLVVLRWRGAIEAAPVVFVGKGITFDTGGVSIKPADRMWEMRADMAGAAACAGAMLSLALRHSPAPAIAVLALAENAIGASSYRPSDVLRSYSGRNIEVVDTDAEGRLVLADALAWAVRHYRPAAIVDLATLTGSIVTALGHHMAGLFSNDPKLAAQVVAAGTASGELVWPMPIGQTHRRDLDSDIADLRHCATGRMQPDACQAAAFLREFAEGVPWVHLDIAGMDTQEKADDRHAAGPTGFGVRLLDRLVARVFEDPHRA